MRLSGWQTRKVPQIIEINNRHKKALTSLLSGIEGVSFAKLADANGDSATFLNLLLPDTSMAQQVIAEFNKSGIGGFNYWFTNMYHFINQWNHLKELKTASKLTAELIGTPQDYKNLSIPKSQEVVGRLVSFGIRCTWADDEVKKLGENIAACIKKVLVKEKAGK